MEKDIIEKNNIYEDLFSKNQLITDKKNTVELENTELTEKEKQNKKKILELLFDKEHLLKEKDDLANNNEVLMKDKQFLENKIKDLDKKNLELTKINNEIINEMNKAVSSANNILNQPVNNNIPKRSINKLIQDINNSFPQSLKELNKKISLRGYIYNDLYTVLKSIHTYNNELNTYNNHDLDSQVFEVLSKLSILCYCVNR